LFSPVVPVSCFFNSGADSLLVLLVSGCSTDKKSSIQLPTADVQLPAYQLDFTTPGNLP